MQLYLSFLSLAKIIELAKRVDKKTFASIVEPVKDIDSVPFSCCRFVNNVIKYFGIPEDIISDRDTRFTGRFWTALFNMMGTELKFSTANHPQTDGQTERMNQVLEEYFRHYLSASQKDCVGLLDMAPFS